MTLKYIQEHAEHQEHNAIHAEKELSLKHGELFRGEVPTGIIIEEDHTVRNVLIAGAVLVAGYFVAKKISNTLRA